MTDKPMRKTIRLPEYAYCTPGIYFVTICTFERTRLFDDPVARHIAERQWRWLPSRHLHVSLDEWIVMPDHVHGLLVLEEPSASKSDAPSESDSVLRVVPGSLGAIVRAYKSGVSRRIHAEIGVRGSVWQRGYWERVIRNQKELDATRAYIANNPLRDERSSRLEALIEKMQYRD